VKDGLLGQIQMDQTGQTETDKQIRLQFTVMNCGSGVDGWGDGSACVPQYWDNMFMSFLDLDGNNERQEEITLHDIWDYYLTENWNIRGFNPLANNGLSLTDQWVYTNPFHAIYPGDDTVDNSKFSTQEGVMFPNMNIEISDPQQVYRWQNQDGNYIDSRLVGDVTVRNRIDLSNNGDVPNPTALDTLTYAQASRAVQGQWVSNKWLNQRYNAISQGDSRTSFEVTMGTAKRTILFAGQATAIVSRCDTCATAQVTCPPGGELIVQRVCSIEDFPTVADIQRCTQEYCCTTTPATSHGDPIIWTFNDECYDLNKDGLYSATKHPDFNHEVKIAVYNNFMREVQVVDNKSGKILLSIDSTGRSMRHVGNKWHFVEEVLDCPEEMETSECDGKYTMWEFDAQNFRYTVHLLRHDYLDDGLLEGQLGYHLDIYPEPYHTFKNKKNGYTGLYFENPLPEELEYCPGGSPRMPED